MSLFITCLYTSKRTKESVGLIKNRSICFEHRSGGHGATDHIPQICSNTNAILLGTGASRKQLVQSDGVFGSITMHPKAPIWPTSYHVWAGQGFSHGTKYTRILTLNFILFSWKNKCLLFKPSSLILFVCYPQWLRQGEYRKNLEKQAEGIWQRHSCLLAHILICHLGEVFKEYTDSHCQLHYMRWHSFGCMPSWNLKC